MPEADDLGKTGRLTLLHESEGGYSQVWRGEKAGRFMAYKSLKEEYAGNPMYEGLLRKEFDIFFRLDHPGICRCYDFRTHPEVGNTIEMEWVDGVTLTEYVTVERPSKKERVRILCEICDALEYIHRHQVVHRDLKPSNILITHNGAYPKIIDFGLSDTDYHASFKGAAGTREYAAPELLSGKSGSSGNAPDIYSLGRIIADILPSRKAVIRKCTASDPRKRYSSALRVKKALRRKMPLPVLLAVCLAVISVGGYFGIKQLRDGTSPEPTGSAVSTSVPQTPADSEAAGSIATTKVFDSAPAAGPDAASVGAVATPAPTSAASGTVTGRTGTPAKTVTRQQNANVGTVSKSVPTNNADEVIGSSELDELFKQATQMLQDGQ